MGAIVIPGLTLRNSPEIQNRFGQEVPGMNDR